MWQRCLLSVAVIVLITLPIMRVLLTLINLAAPVCSRQKCPATLPTWAMEMVADMGAPSRSQSEWLDRQWRWWQT